MDKVDKALGLTFFAHDLTPPREVTVREWLGDLLMQVWREKEGFSGKRPWGNSGWNWDVAIPLISEGLIAGSIYDGYVEECDDRALDKLIRECIERMSKP